MATTAVKKKKKFHVFPIINIIIFLIITLIIMIPIWKVLVDSFDAASGYGMQLWPSRFTFGGYTLIATRRSMYLPFVISLVVTIVGSFLGLTLSTLGAYVLIQWQYGSLPQGM